MKYNSPKTKPEKRKPDPPHTLSFQDMFGFISSTSHNFSGATYHPILPIVQTTSPPLWACPQPHQKQHYNDNEISKSPPPNEPLLHIWHWTITPKQCTIILFNGNPKKNAGPIVHTFFSIKFDFPQNDSWYLMIFDDPYSATFGLEGIVAKDVWQTNSIAKGRMWSLNSPWTGCFLFKRWNGSGKGMSGDPHSLTLGKNHSVSCFWSKFVVCNPKMFKGGYFSVTSLLDKTLSCWKLWVVLPTSNKNTYLLDKL